MHPNDSPGSIGDTREQEDLIVSPRAEISSVGADRTVVKIAKREGEVPSFEPQLAIYSSNSVLVWSAQSSLSEFSLCPNAFGGGSPNDLLPEEGNPGLPCDV